MYPRSIVPGQDPLLRSTSGRVQRCELARDFELEAQVLGTGHLSVPEP